MNSSIPLKQIIRSLRAKTVSTHSVLPLDDFRLDSHLTSKLVNFYDVGSLDQSVVANSNEYSIKHVTND